MSGNKYPFGQTFGAVDLLSEVDLKTAWETERSASVAVMAVISTFLLLLRPEITFTCVALNQNFSESDQLLKFAGNRCGSEVQYFLPAVLLIVVTTEVGLYVYDTLWTIYPSVRKPIIWFSQVLELQEQSRFNLSSLKRAITIPNRRKEGKHGKKIRKDARKICYLLRSFIETSNDGRNDKSISDVVVKSYNKRNFIWFICTAIPYFAFIFMWGVICFILQSYVLFSGVLPCSIPDHVDFTFTCAYTGTEIFFLIFMTYFFILGGLWGISLMLWLKHRKKNDIELLESFAGKDQDKKTPTFAANVVKTLMHESGKLIKQAEGNLFHAAANKDIDFFLFIANTLDVDVPLAIKRQGIDQEECYRDVYTELEAIFGDDVPQPTHSLKRK